MTTDVLELPPVAHIVAELDDSQTQELDIARLMSAPWILPTLPAESRRSKGGFSILALIALVVSAALVIPSAARDLLLTPRRKADPSSLRSSG
jgi:hypothetical protein